MWLFGVIGGLLFATALPNKDKAVIALQQLCGQAALNTGGTDFLHPIGLVDPVPAVLCVPN